MGNESAKIQYELEYYKKRDSQITIVFAIYILCYRWVLGYSDIWFPENFNRKC